MRAMLFDILDHFSSPFADLDQASQFLHGLRGEFDVTNLSYWHIGTRGTKPAQAIWLSTYPEPYRTTYLERGLQRTDPAFVLSFARLLPTDWDAIHRLDGSRAVLEAANAHRIPVRGIAVPIRDETTGDSLFNVNLDCHEAEWKLRRNALARDFMVIGHVFHVMMRGLVRGSEPLIELPRLSPREVDVMRLAAQGYSAKRTALKLGISPHSVRVHLTLARRRLKARNTAEAVAIALTRGLLT
ncbi:MAG TPA: autoinducer binding domain-containing protein [Aestuariivirgaceae bacterium]|nr:autoinducer binding domain-containing protein [Aestuariivirgaceae bacterium]